MDIVTCMLRCWGVREMHVSGAVGRLWYADVVSDVVTWCGTDICYMHATILQMCEAVLYACVYFCKCVNQSYMHVENPANV